jgi:uncharacterized protein YtpQ (UPF0354 family)
MDKKLNKDLVDFFYGNPDTWDKILIEDTHRKKGEIGSCCSSHALEQFVSHYDPKAIEDLFDAKQLITAEIKSIKKGLDINVLNAIAKWRCDDDEHNENIIMILDIAKKEMKK